MLAGGAAAQQQDQGVNQERLSGSGLSRKHLEARRELKFEVVDEGKMGNAQISEHNHGAYSPP